MHVSRLEGVDAPILCFIASTLFCFFNIPGSRPLVVLRLSGTGEPRSEHQDPSSNIPSPNQVPLVATGACT